MKKYASVFGLVCSLLLTFVILGCKSKDAKPSVKPTDPTPMQATGQTVTPTGQAKKSEIPQYAGYTLLWHDEFDGDSLNTENWNMEARQPGWTNNELQEYTQSTDNIFIRDGKLVLKAIKTQKN